MSARADATPLVGMIVFLASLAMVFFALLFAFGMAREGLVAWSPPALGSTEAALPVLSAAIAAASSALLEWGRRADRAAPCAAAAALAPVFLLVQIKLWTALARAGLDPAAPADGMVYALAGFHGAHAAVGAIGLAWSMARARRGRRGSLRYWSMFWHFVGAWWLAIYAAVFVV